MMSVELTHLADMLDEIGQLSNFSALARNYSSTISNAIWNTTVIIPLTNLADGLSGLRDPARLSITSLRMRRMGLEADMLWMMLTFRYVYCMRHVRSRDTHLKDYFVCTVFALSALSWIPG